MKIVNPSIEIMRSGLETNPCTPEQFIEKVGRTCYKSEDKITEDSAAKFVSGLVKRGHEAMIEHWNLIFKTDAHTYERIWNAWRELMTSVHSCEHSNNAGLAGLLRPYLRFTKYFVDDEQRYIVSGNMLAWRDYMQHWVDTFDTLPNYVDSIIRDYPCFFPEYQEYINNEIVEDLLKPITEKNLVGPVEHGVHHNVTVKFICDRGVSHEIVRHRTASFAQESTRYCNYSKDKYGNEITVVKPAWMLDTEKSPTSGMYNAWINGCIDAERHYFTMINGGATPQEARAVLPNSLKTEVIMTGNLDCWDHFFHLRCAPDAHPDIQVVAKMVRDEFRKLFPERYYGEV